MSCLDKTRAVVAAALHVPVERVAPEAVLGEIAPLDSLSLAEIASALDDAFAIRLPSEELTTSQTVGDLAGLVERSPRR